MRNMLNIRNIRLRGQKSRRWTIALAPELARTKPSQESWSKLSHDSSNLGHKVQCGQTGTAVGEPLGTRQVAVMILGVVPICCRIPARSLCLGKSPVPGVEG